MTFIMVTVSLVIALIALWATARLDARDRKENEFYLNEFSAKIGGKITWRQRLAAWNGAKGGRAPAWHWIEPVAPLPPGCRVGE
jgi:hypothetical protein